MRTLALQCTATIAIVTAVSFLTPAANAAAINLDFGNDEGTSSAPLGPAHTANGGGATVPDSQATWNSITADDVTITYGDGSAATGVAVDIGLETSTTSDVIDYTINGPLVDTGATSTPTHLSSDMGQDYLRTTVNGQALSARVTGLATGSYLVYVVADNPFSATVLDSNVFVDVGSSASSTFDYSASPVVYLENNPTSHSGTSTWLLNDNYALFMVYVGVGESINVVVDDTFNGSTETNNKINGIQIVAVPSPAALPAGLAMLALGFTRRRRR